ncbi:MAG: hypothetical protein JW900_10320 [Anaerolineae bacterium]|nr:hypothetical protein [Anaerolineae bacterium]
MNRFCRLSLAILCLLLLAGCSVSPSEMLFSWTGEEELPGQLYGTYQLAGNLLRPGPQTADYAPVAHAGLNPFGINVFLEQEVELEKREQVVRMVAAAGFYWIRQEFPWEDIEIHGRGDFVDRRNDLDGDGQVDAVDAWAKYDHIVDLAGQYGLQLIVRLSNPPAWSRADGDARGTYAPPDDPADYGNYVYAVVSRYRGRIRYYQLWNEPNIYPEWGEQPVDPAAYTQLLCEGYRRAKEADPNAVIVSGALAQTISFEPGPGPGTGLSDLVFLQRMYDAGAANCFDVLAVNDYMLWSGPTDHRLPPAHVINFNRPLYLRDVMVANGDAHKPIWISEMNSNAVPNDPAIQDVGRYGQVTPDQQARYAALAYQRVMEEWPWAGVVNFWFFKRPSDAEANQSWYYFRMVEPDFAPLPVYDAMREYTAALRPVLYPGTHQEDHWALSYEGEWETAASPDAVLGAYRAAGAGATLAFTFEGHRLTLTPGPGSGEIEVVVDDRAARRISLTGQPVQLFASWAAGRHTVRITALSGSAGVDSLAVRQPNWGRRAACAGAMLLGIGGLAWIARRRRAYECAGRQYRSAGSPSPTRRA